jgi:hypothetical protein
MSLPALMGGAPIRPQGPPAWPPADPEILEVLQQAYRDGWWGKYQAGQSERLEAVLREYHKVEHVLLCASGNYAVELGLRALKIAAGDEVILADYDYPGNFSASTPPKRFPSWSISIRADGIFPSKRCAGPLDRGRKQSWRPICMAAACRCAS